jgi:hypothetical protein
MKRKKVIKKLATLIVTGYQIGMNETELAVAMLEAFGQELCLEATDQAPAIAAELDVV